MSTIETIIKETFETFREFIYRDLMYVVGGISVLLSVCYCFGGPPISAETWTLLYACFLGYIVGYALQEIFSVFGIVTTAYRKLGPIRLFWAKRFAPDERWDHLPLPANILMGKLRYCVGEHCPKDTRKRIDRTINLKHLGASGASFFVVGIFLFVASYKHPCDSWVVPLAVGAVALAIILALMSQTKSAQQRLMELDVNRQCEQCKGSAEIKENSIT